MAALPVTRTLTVPRKAAARRARNTKRASASSLTPAIFLCNITTLAASARVVGKANRRAAALLRNMRHSILQLVPKGACRWGFRLLPVFLPYSRPPHSLVLPAITSVAPQPAPCARRRREQCAGQDDAAPRRPRRNGRTPGPRRF